MQLNFKTRGKDVSPQGKPRVYFCCHPEDFPLYFSTISQEILNLENCAIFYDECPCDVADQMEWESRLSGMQLFVMPVTTKLLSGANKGLDDYQIAIKHHIPVLPLMQEQGLDGLFNEVCGNLQYLDKYQKDDTAISYQEKLKNFLDGVLVGDEEAQAIRGAFRAYIFLSYRKKDRVHAQRLMRLVHKSQFCHDVAIWYDEYLVPGEDFNNAIGDALSKSEMFLLSVTPNLVCESNYVQSVEYPMALQAGKVILPVEMSCTDGQLLASQYANLPTVISESDEQTLMRELEKIFPQTVNLYDDLPRCYLVALAYLDGIDVEVDHDRAFAMLSYCAEKGHVDSLKALAEMYKSGKGVERDISKAIQWQKRVVDALLPQAQGDDNDAKLRYIFALDKLALLYRELLQYQQAIDVYNQFKDFSKQWVTQQEDDQTAKSMLCLAYNNIGEMYVKLYDYDQALEHFRWALHYAERLVDGEQSEANYNDLINCYGNMSRCYECKKDFQSALTYSEARLKVLNIIADMTNDDDYWFSLMQCHADIFDICKATCEIVRARESITKAVQIAERIDSEQNDDISQEWLLLAYNRMASLCYMEEKFDEEREWYLKSLAISIKLVDKYASLDARQTLAELLRNLADNARILGNYDEAEDYISKALYLRETIAEEVLITETKFQLALTYSAAATLYDKLLKKEQCIQLLEKSESLLLELISQNNAVKFRSALADCYYWMGLSYDNSSNLCRQSYEKGLQIMLELHDELKDDHTLTQVGSFYYTLGGIYAKNNPNKALEYYLKVFEIDLDYAQNHQSIDRWRQCVVDLVDLGDHYHKNICDDESALKCYTNAMDIAKDLLNQTDSPKVRNSYAALLGSIATFYEDNNQIQKAIDYSEEELTIYQGLAEQVPVVDHFGGVFSTAFLLAQFYNAIGDQEQSKKFNILALETMVANKDDFISIGYVDTETIVVLCKAIAANCALLQQLDQSLHYCNQALEYATQAVQQGDCEQSVVTDVLRQISKVYNLQQDYSTQLNFALQVVEDSLTMAQADEDEVNLFDCASDCKALAECYANLKDMQNAIEYYTITKALCEQICQSNPPSDDGFGCVNQFYIQSTRLLAEVNFQIGDIYYIMDDKDTTIQYLAPAIEIALDLANLTDETNDWLLLATYCYYLGSFTSIEPLQKAEEVLQMVLENNPFEPNAKKMIKLVREVMKKYQ